ncbi:MAG: antibiotic biosynthesis monooxygenase [Candidatus Brocadiae bacterium]|nr:antibiotic biosynthesis monooxygenase [Candidatus Brocadiia bacterium]
MHITLVHVEVQRENIQNFIQASVENHNGSVQEKGNVRFDVIQNAEDPCKFILYEVYESEQAALEHKKTAHYLKWKETVAGWMAKPRQGVRYNAIAPEDRKKW